MSDQKYKTLYTLRFFKSESTCFNPQLFDFAIKFKYDVFTIMK